MAFVFWLTSAMMAGNAGVEAEVPPTTLALMSCPLLLIRQAPSWHNRYPSCRPALNDRSGRSRFPSLGTPAPACQDGLLYRVLGPPPLANKLGGKHRLGSEQLPFQTASGT